jgi:hypothetical protein
MTPPGKTRTRAHVLADLSINHVERQALLCGYAVERVQHDYGYDLTMSTFSETGEFEAGYVYIQVKATDRLPRLADGKTISWPVSRRDLKLWLRETYPVILVIYDGQKEKAYWVHIQAYISGRATAGLFAGRETINVRIRMANRLTPSAFRAIRRSKNDLQKRLSGTRP